VPAISAGARDLLPRSKIQAVLGDRYDDLAAHDLPLEMGVAVVSSAAPSTALRAGLRSSLADTIVTIAADRLVGRQFLQPVVVVLVQAPFIIVCSIATITVACPLCCPPRYLVRDYGVVIPSARSGYIFWECFSLSVIMRSVLAFRAVYTMRAS